MEEPYKAPEFDASGKPVYSVEECVFVMNESLIRLGVVRVKGEIQGIKLKHPHAYFDIKDASGKEYVLNCALFGWKFQRFGHLLQEGMEVIVSGRPNVYKNGKLSFIAEELEPSGEGAWLRALEALKKKLTGKGYFSQERKRPISRFARRIGLITSSDGQAIHDFRTNLKPHGFQVSHYPVWVEGEHAEASIVAAFSWLNRNMPDLDAVVLIRGGGAAESLKVFNSEKIADAIFLSRIPVVTGVGHEKDESLADLVADVRCSTPTGAAVFLRSLREQLHQEVEASSSLLATHAEHLIRAQRVSLRHVTERLEWGFGRIFDQFHEKERVFSQAEQSLENSLRGFWEKLRHLDARLSSLSPECVLSRGYSIAFGASGKIIKDVAEVEIGEHMTTRLARGSISSRVERKEV
ncbi:MAG: exodeoxyribonuclease VII large subunit [Candidatus Yanofskybacteria bacterium]|nr:exodeoxyribonuclease VII large subunit [Candidatus Yanofskybacteria bacterium]